MLNEKNRALHAGLLKILNEATFPLKAKEVNAFSAVYNWVKEMPKNLTEVSNNKEQKKVAKK